MKLALCATAILLLGIPCAAQSASSGTAETKGACSPAVSGNNNRIQINCKGVSPKLISQLIELLNRAANSQTDTETLSAKLDACTAPWRLDSAEKERLRIAVPKIQSRIEIDALPISRDAALFGGDLLAAFREFGLNVDPVLDMNYALNAQDEGVTIVVNHADFPEAAALQQALVSVFGKAMIHAEVNATVVADPGKIIVVVGAKQFHP